MAEFLNYVVTLWPQLWGGLKITLGLFAWTLLLAIPLGVLVAWMRMSRFALVRMVVKGYIWVFRGTPLLLQVVFLYYGLPRIGIVLDPFPTACAAFCINYAAYFAEIFRGGIQSIDRGQHEAANVLGLGKGKTMLRIILPQALKRVLPSVGNEAITLIKDSALVYVISIADLMRVVTLASIRDMTITPFFIAAIFYLVMTFVLERVMGWIERRFSYYE